MSELTLTWRLGGLKTLFEQEMDTPAATAAAAAADAPVGEDELE